MSGPPRNFYDLNKDPHEINNLALNPAYHEQLEKSRARMDQWIKDTDDKGQYPEDEPNLRFTYERWGDEKCINPEYDPFRVNEQAAAGIRCVTVGLSWTQPV